GAKACLSKPGSPSSNSLRGTALHLSPFSSPNSSNQLLPSGSVVASTHSWLTYLSATSAKRVFTSVPAVSPFGVWIWLVASPLLWQPLAFASSSNENGIVA